MNEPIVFTDQALYLLHAASSQAKRLGHKTPTAAHILMSVEKQPPSLAEHILSDVKVDVDELREVLDTILHDWGVANLSSEGIVAIQERSRLNAVQFKSRFVETEHVLLSALQLADIAVKLAFERLRVSLDAAVARAEAVTQDVAERKVLRKRQWPAMENLIQLL